MTSLTINRDKLFANIRGPLFGGSLRQEQVNGIEGLLDVWEDYGLGDNWAELAYDMATAQWETAHTMQPITEYGSLNYFDKYAPGTRIGKVLGNTEPGDGYRFRGEGHVMNTGRRNARVATERLNELFGLGVDLVRNPSKRGAFLVSALSLFIGNREGWWTGRELSDYIDGVDESDAEDLREFIAARYVVNGTDKAEKIARLAVKWELAIRASLEPGHVKPKPVAEPAPAVYDPPAWKAFIDWVKALINQLKGLFHG